MNKATKKKYDQFIHRGGLHGDSRLDELWNRNDIYAIIERVLANKRVPMKNRILLCRKCDGRGYLGSAWMPRDCPTCGGTGKHKFIERTGI